MNWRVLFAVTVSMCAHTSFGAACGSPQSIQDIVICQNQILEENPSSAVSQLVEHLSPFASLACTRSRASAQPAYPDEGDFRCFLVFPSGVTLSVNILENLNHNHIEVSENYQTAEHSGVVLGFFSMSERADLASVLESSLEPIRGRMTCGSCHRLHSRSKVSVSGGEGWPMAAIAINSTLSGTVPRSGQIHPDLLDGELEVLHKRHNCDTAVASETCRRLKALRAAPSRLPMANPN